MERLTNFGRPFNRDSVLRLLTSIGLAAILWAFVTTINDPEKSRTFANVPIMESGISDQLTVVNDIGTTEVKINGPESVVNRVDANEVHASIDLSQITTTGNHAIPIQLHVPEDLWRTSSDRSTVTVVVEPLSEKQLPVEIDVTDIDESSLRNVSVVPDIDTVTVTGPQSQVKRVASVVLPVESSGGSRSYKSVFVPEALDSNGTTIESVTLQPSAISATVTVAERGKSVAVLVTTNGVPADGFDVLDRTSNPTTVIIDGPDDLVSKIIAVSTEAVDISGANASITTDVGLVGLPEGVSVIRPADERVDVLIQIGQRGVDQTLTSVPVTVTNLEPGLVATIEPPTLSIDIDASQDSIAALTSDDVQAIIDVSGLEAGSYPRTPSVVVPPGVKWTAINPGEVTVTIASATDTPSSSPSANE